MSASDIEAVLEELGETMRAVDQAALRKLQERLVAARRVFVAGAGRSGLVVRAFAMRLMHLGLHVYVVGDVTTPAFAAGDLLVIGSGSGETDSLCVVGRKAKALGGILAVVTIVPSSTLGQLADVVVRVDADSPKAAAQAGRPPRRSVQPMGTLFEQTMLLLLDAVVMRLAAARGTSPAMRTWSERVPESLSFAAGSGGYHLERWPGGGR
jgi:6-phospho-3-hexuloisomerase